MSKRRKGFPSETQVKRGVRVVHGSKELTEKLGRNDPCPCGSGKRFRRCCLKSGCFYGVNRHHYFQRRLNGPARFERAGQFFVLRIRGRGANNRIGIMAVEVAMAKNILRTGKKVRPKTAIKGKRYRCAKCRRRSPKPVKTPAPWYCLNCLNQDKQ